jgi:hypothetical protein
MVDRSSATTSLGRPPIFRRCSTHVPHIGHALTPFGSQHPPATSTCNIHLQHPLQHPLVQARPLGPCTAATPAHNASKPGAPRHTGPLADCQRGQQLRRPQEIWRVEGQLRVLFVMLFCSLCVIGGRSCTWRVDMGPRCCCTCRFVLH